MNNDWTIKKLFEEICQIEIEHKLFEKEIDGVYIWKLIRFSLFTELSMRLNLLENPHPNQKQNDNRYIGIIKHFINGTFNGPLTHSSNAEIILFTHPRKVMMEDSRLIDIYSYYLEDKWEKEGTGYLAIEKPYNGIFIRKTSKIVRHNETLNLFTLQNYFKPKIDIDFSINELDNIANIPIENIKTLSKENISKVIHAFKREYHYYTKVLTKHRPKKVYMVVAYFRHALVAAAADLGIETIEIQHGELTPFSIGYTYPEHINIPYFPEKLILWGKFWYDNSQLPIDEKNISYDGFPFLDEEINKYSDILRNESRVLFVSQGKIGKSLVNIALEFAGQNKEYKVVYRLHPSEAEQWKTLYPKLYSFSMENNNFLVETGAVNPLYKSFAESMFVVGVNSTALIESLAANCKLILVDLPGVEYFQSLIDKELVKKVKNAEQLAKAIKEDDKLTSINSDYFFTKRYRK